MPPPVNIDIAHAIEVFPLPSVNTQQVDFGGTTYAVYYSLNVPIAGDIGIWAFGDLSVYKPQLQVIDTDGVSNYLGGFFANNVPVQVPFLVGKYYLRIASNPGNPTPANLTLRAEYAPSLPVSIGDLFINDDTDGFPGVFISHTSNYTDLRFIFPFPAGEAGDRLLNGVMLFEDVLAGDMKLFDKDFNQLVSVAYWSTGLVRIRTANAAGKFYVGLGGGGATHASARSVDANGNFGLTTYTFDAAGLAGLAVNNDESIIYYTGSGGTAAPIKTWITASNTRGSDLAPGLITYVVGDILCLADNSLVVVYLNSTTNVRVIRYDPSGTILATTNFPGVYHNFPPRLFYTNDDPNSYGVWLHPTTNVGTINYIRASDGVVIQTLYEQDYEDGLYIAPSTTAPVRFGISQSCPIIVLPTTTSGGPGFPVSGTGGTGGGTTTAVIIVSKTGTPLGDTTQFQFSISGGLSPATFVLIGGQNQIFNDVPVGTYIIAEIAGNFHTVIDINGVTYDTTSVAVTVSTTGTIAVTVTNTFFGEFSGIYYIHPDKTNDTVFTSIVSPTVFTTAVVKIPNPFVLL